MRAAVLNRCVVVALLAVGPLLTGVFWYSMSIGSKWPYRESDLINGIAAVCAAVVLLALAILVIIRWCRGDLASYVNVPSAVVLATSSAYCAVVSVTFLDLGSSCADPYCWYELGQIVWWLLWAVDWVALGILAVVATLIRFRLKREG